MSKNKFKLEPLPLIKTKEEHNSNGEKSSEYAHIQGYISIEMLDKVKDYIYWEGMTVKEFIPYLLEDFFKDKEIKSRPARLKNKPRKKGRSKLA